MGFQRPDKNVIKFVTSPGQSIEIIGAFVSKHERGKGVGKSLFSAIESEAKNLDYKEIVIWSGPRYKETGWQFYDNLLGLERVGFVGSEEFPVWKKILR